MEAVEESLRPAATAHPVGHPSGGGVQGHPQPSGLPVYGRDKHVCRVQRALDNRWLAERGVPSLVQQWVELHYGRRKEPTPEAVNLTGTA